MSAASVHQSLCSRTLHLRRSLGAGALVGVRRAGRGGKIEWERLHGFFSLRPSQPSSRFSACGTNLEIS
jgi:hypothetical protein